MAVPKIYTSEDAGIEWPSPEFSTETGYAIHTIRLLKIVLKACLVDGYAGSPPAGWSMLYDGIATGEAERFAITNASKTGVMIAETASNNNYIHMGAADSFTPPNTPVNYVSGAYHETLAPSGDRQLLGMPMNTPLTLSNFRFVVIATPEACVVHLYHKDYKDKKATSTYGYYLTTLFIGACKQGFVEGLELGNFVVQGGQVTSSQSIQRMPRVVYKGQKQAISTCRNPDGSLLTELTEFRAYPPVFAYYVQESYQGYCFIRAVLQTYNLPHKHLLATPFFINIYHGSIAHEYQSFIDAGEAPYQIVTRDGVQFMPINTGKEDYLFVSLDSGEWL